MSYRTIEINWIPKTQAQWKVFSACRSESGRLWCDLVERHFRLRRSHKKWPSKDRWQKWAKRKYPMLHSQSVQQIIGEFYEACKSASTLRKNKYEGAEYPNKKPKFRDVPYTNQAAKIDDGVLTLPNCGSGKLRIRVPVSMPGRLMEARLCMGRILLVCMCAEEAKDVETTIGVDLGVNTLIAATDGDKVVLISGRRVKSLVRLRNKRLGSLVSLQSKKMRGSRQWRKLQRTKAKMLAKNRRQIKDACHKATRIVANEFPNAKVYVGKPFNSAAKKIGRVNAQMVSSACNAKIIRMLDYKTCGAIEVEEAYSSQTCPVCGRRARHNRIYKCSHCGLNAPRDVVGAVNIRQIGLHDVLQSVSHIPKTIKYRHYMCRSRPDTAQVACL